MNIVITGALGHIGSRLIRVLPRLIPNAQITMVDNLSTSRYPSLFKLPSNGQYRFIETDICNADPDIFLRGADVVVHLAAITDAASSFEMAEEVEKINARATLRVAKSCASMGIKFVFASTTSVYGVQEGIVTEDCTEEDLKPQSPYATAKLSAEKGLLELSERQSLQHVTFRFGTIFGVSPGMRFHTAVNKFCWQAVMGQPITVWRTALHQKRPYLDLGDCVRAISFSISKNLFDGRIFNVLTCNTTVNDIVSLIRERIFDAEITYVDEKIMNQLSYEVSNARIRSEGFRSRGSLQKGISQSIDWLQRANNL